MDLGILRDEIDEIDGKIVDLYEKRMDIWQSIRSKPEKRYLTERVRKKRSER